MILVCRERWFFFSSPSVSTRAFLFLFFFLLSPTTTTTISATILPISLASILFFFFDALPKEKEIISKRPKKAILHCCERFFFRALCRRSPRSTSSRAFLFLFSFALADNDEKDDSSSSSSPSLTRQLFLFFNSPPQEKKISKKGQTKRKILSRNVKKIKTRSLLTDPDHVGADLLEEGQVAGQVVQLLTRNANHDAGPDLIVFLSSK